MVDSDLVTAIQNAVARKQTVESAMQSLLNAGYSKEDVQEAARQALATAEAAPAQAVQVPTQNVPAEKKPSSKKKKIIFLIIALSIILLGIGAFVAIKFFF
jgi:uncharacterized membrane protein YvbJ